MVELVDSVDLGSTAKSVQVRVLLPAPNQYNPNQIFPVGDGFGLFVFFGKFEETHFRNGVIKRPESKPRGPRKKETDLGGNGHGQGSDFVCVQYRHRLCGGQIL